MWLIWGEKKQTQDASKRGKFLASFEKSKHLSSHMKLEATSKLPPILETTSKVWIVFPEMTSVGKSFAMGQTCFFFFLMQLTQTVKYWCKMTPCSSICTAMYRVMTSNLMSHGARVQTPPCGSRLLWPYCCRIGCMSPNGEVRQQVWY